jgi:hypothetical protein
VRDSALTKHLVEKVSLQLQYFWREHRQPVRGEGVEGRVQGCRVADAAAAAATRSAAMAEPRAAAAEPVRFRC